MSGDVADGSSSRESSTSCRGSSESRPALFCVFAPEKGFDVVAALATTGAGTVETTADGVTDVTGALIGTVIGELIGSAPGDVGRDEIRTLGSATE